MKLKLPGLHIDASNFQDHIRHFDGGGDEFGRGLIMPPEDEGFSAGPTRFPFKVPAREAWPDLIADKVRKGESLRELMKATGIKVKNQGRLPFCWGFSPTIALEIVRAMQGDGYEELSPESVCCPITGFRLRGGYGIEALTFMSNAGVVPTSMWPRLAVDRRYATAAADAQRKNFRAPQWLKLQSGNVGQIVTCCLRGIPVSVGLNWWRHQVTLLEAYWVKNELIFLFVNSWGERYGELGFATMSESQAADGDAVAPLMMAA